MKKEDYFYTKGPWEMNLILDSDYSCWEVTALSESNLVSDFDLVDGEMVVEEAREEMEICHRMLDEPSIELGADMKMIAATPDLFELCIESFNELKRLGGNELLIKQLEKTIEAAGTTNKELDEQFGKSR